MRKLVLMSMCLLFVWTANAQNTNKGVCFLDNEAWETVVKKAQKQKKPIFVDCYTSWCGPCRKLASEVFTREDVGELLNKRFVCVKYDVEKGAGLDFARKYRDQIHAFPTLLHIKTDGTVIQRTVGVFPAEELMATIKNGLDGQTWQVLEKEYNTGNREYDFVMAYLDMLLKSGEEKRYEEVKRAYVKQFPVDSLLNPQIWELSKDYIANPWTEEYRFLLGHLNDFDNRGFDRHDLEWTLAILAYYPLSDIIKKSLKENGTENKEEWKKQLKDLEEVLDHPVKNFPEYRSYVRLEQSYLDGNAEELAYRLIYWGENHLLNSLNWEKAWTEYAIDRISDERLIRRCVNYLQSRQTANETDNDWIVENCYDVLAKGYAKLGNQTKAEACTRKSAEVEKRNKEKLKDF